MKTHLYLSILPEALVGSMLAPEEFARHLAVGSGRAMRSQALFFEVDRDEAAKYFDLARLDVKCVPYPDGTPRSTSYVAVYRVLERLPRRALKRLHLVARDGTSLALDPGNYNDPGADVGRAYLYQELCPVSPLVVARLSPTEFAREITSPKHAVYVPRIIFNDCRLNDIDIAPRANTKLPYRQLEHILYSLEELKRRPSKISKLVDREMQHDIQFWMIESGIFVGDQDGITFYPMPDEETLRRDRFDWWSSARAVEVM